MLSQPKIDVESPVVPTASFEPPVVRTGESTTYRITLNALEESIELPNKITAPTNLIVRAGAHAQILAVTGMMLQPRTTFNYRLQATELGQFTIPEFNVKVYGKQISVPAAQLTVAATLPDGLPPVQQLGLGLSNTNPFVGEAVHARLVLSSQPGTAVQSLGQVQINGQGFIVDQGSARPRIEMLRPRLGVPALPTFTYEIILTPIASGTLSAFAQAFATGNRIVGGGLIIAGAPNQPPNLVPQYTLFDSDPVQFKVRELPRQGQLPGFTGAVGTFTLDKPELGTNIVAVGEPVKLKVKVYGDGNLLRLVPPPAPRPRDWQLLPARNETVPPQFVQAQGFATLSYILIPSADKSRATPAIPFSGFDPQLGAYVDLTIPPVPIKIIPGAAAVDLTAVLQANSADTQSEKEPALSALATASGLAAGSLYPLQRQLWFPLMQLVPGAAFLGLWTWDRRRRFLEQHPDLVLRRRARRALRHERRTLRRAANAKNSTGFATTAVNAMRVACAPHYPAEARAMVASDVLPILPESARTSRPGEVVQRFFAVTDASRFGKVPAELQALLALHSDLELVLDQLESRL